MSQKTSTVQNKIAFLDSAIDKQLSAFKKRSKFNRSASVLLRGTISILGVIITVLLGLQVAALQRDLNNIALVFSGVITILNSLESIFSYRTFWIRYTITTNQLHGLKSDLAYLSAAGAETVREDDLDKLYRRYKMVLEETNAAWAETRRDAVVSDPSQVA